jgi:hypothetical protein
MKKCLACEHSFPPNDDASFCDQCGHDLSDTKKKKDDRVYFSTEDSTEKVLEIANFAVRFPRAFKTLDPHSGFPQHMFSHYLGPFASAAISNFLDLEEFIQMRCVATWTRRWFRPDSWQELRVGTFSVSQFDSIVGPSVMNLPMVDIHCNMEQAKVNLVEWSTTKRFRILGCRIDHLPTPRALEKDKPVKSSLITLVQKCSKLWNWGEHEYLNEAFLASHLNDRGATLMTYSLLQIREMKFHNQNWECDGDFPRGVMISGSINHLEASWDISEVTSNLEKFCELTQMCNTVCLTLRRGQKPSNAELTSIKTVLLSYTFIRKANLTLFFGRGIGQELGAQLRDLFSPLFFR